MRRAGILAALVAGLVLAPSLAAADTYYYLPFKMLNTSTNPFPWYLDGRATNPVGLSLASVQASTQNAWLTWDNVSCASTAFTFKGSTAGVVPLPPDPYDVYNVSTIWVTSASDPFYTMNLASNDITSLTLPLSYAGVLQQCDIYMNGVNPIWQTGTPTQPTAVDLESIVLHEVGHCQGLDHSFTDDLDVMYATTPIGAQKRVLTTRDITALCNQYPAIGAQGSACLADGGCGANTAVKCVKPPQSDGGAGVAVCTIGCPTGVNFQCTAPYACKPSTLFAPTYNGACLPPGEFVTLVGHPCTASTECGSTNGECIPQGVQPSTAALWPDGYCSQNCGPGMPGCPSGSACIDFGAPMGQVCLKNCRVGTADCRPGYTCVLPPTGDGVCVSSCHSNTDCDPSGTQQCRVCDGTCLMNQNPSAQIGDPCSTGDQCGAGQVCAMFTTSIQGICSQNCTSACGACPVGTTCHPVGSRGELYCLRDCQPHSCPPGLQCGMLPSGRGCMPPCHSTIECPVGNSCENGECINPYEYYDAGCTLCPTQQDGGDKPTNGAPDAGSAPPIGSGGCGCQAEGGVAGMLGLIALALALAMRRTRVERVRVNARRPR